MYRQVLNNCLRRNWIQLDLTKFNNVKKCNSLITVSSKYSNIRQLSNLTYNYKHANEEQYLAKLKNDPNVFGDAAAEEEALEDEGDIEERNRLEDQPLHMQKLTIKQYADQIKMLISKRKVKEAIDILEIKMLKVDKVKPENYTYNLLIGACGRLGYTKQAFSLYNNMKKRGLQPTAGTYTALFNACSNSPWPTTDGLDRAKHLYESLIEKQFEPNVTNYNAMIKAFGRCGDLEMAFALVDEMATKRYAIKSETLNFLLQACISDKDTGFRHALLVWRKFIQKHIKPNLFSFNLMLRCIRDCDIGDLETTKDVIDKIISSSVKQKLLNKTKTNIDSEVKEISENDSLTEISENDSLTEIIPNVATVENSKNIEIVETRDNNLTDNSRPNLMASVPTMGNVLSLTEIVKAEDRLLLVGGWTGFLENMKENNCMPNIKTFTQLLDSLPSTNSAEASLMQIMHKLGIKPDVDFFNMLIKKRSMRFDYEGGRDVLNMIEAAKLQPNLITYGVLALGCKQILEAQELLTEMEDAKYIVNIEIIGAMLTQAMYRNNFSYVMYLMQLCISENLSVSKKFLENLENFKKKVKDISNNKQNSLSHSSSFQKGHKLFRDVYKDWLNQIQVDDTDKIHPWQQFRQTTETNTKYYKEKDSRFKPVHISKFKQKSNVRDIKKHNKY